MSIKEMSFLEYISYEEQNFLTTLVNFREEFDLFFNLDKIYQEPLKRLELKPTEETVVGQLYLFVHFHLYFSISNILRSHLSEALTSLRSAIDGGLTAYQIITHPESASIYIDKSCKENYQMFQKIKNYIANERKKAPSTFPLAETLIKTHEACSTFGSHADIDTFVHRLETAQATGGQIDQLKVHYFQYPKNPNEYKFYYIVILEAFFNIFRIFKTFFDSKLKIIDERWENTIKAMGPHLSELRIKHHKQI